MESFKVMCYWDWKEKFITKSMETFPTEHSKYESYLPKTNDGIDLIEMKEYMVKARESINKSLQKCSNDKE